MNTDTGELIRPRDEDCGALLYRQPVMLPAGKSAHERMTMRVGRLATDRQLAAIRKSYEAMGQQAFWNWIKANAPDITPYVAITCGQAQRILGKLPAATVDASAQGRRAAAEARQASRQGGAKRAEIG